MNLVKEVITLPESYSITKEDEQARGVIVKRAAKVTAVASTASNELARSSAVEIRRHLKDVETARTSLTAPLLAAQRLIKSLADTYCEPLKAELTRLERLGTDWTLAEERRVAEAERIQRLEIERLDKERIEAEARANKLAEKVNTPGQLHKAIEAEEKVTAIAQQQQAVFAAPQPEVRKAKGQTTKQNLRWEVEDLAKVYAARPELCRLEIKPSAVQATCVPEMPVPGLKLWWETTSTYNSR